MIRTRQQPVADLADALAEVASRLDGILGVCIRYLPDGPAYALNADEMFPPASVIKVPILVETFAQADRGTIALAQRIPLRDTDRVGGSGVLQFLTPGLAPTVHDLAELMIAVSDNTATNMLIDLLGVDAINARMRALGLERTTLAGKLALSYAVDGVPPPPCDPAQPTNRRSVTTPREMCRLVELLWRGEAVSAEASRRMLAILGHQNFMELVRYLPYDDRYTDEPVAPHLTVASKSGSINGVRNDVALFTVATPEGSRAYIVSAFTRDVRDARLWTPENAGLLALGEVGYLAYRHLLDVLVP